MTRERREFHRIPQEFHAQYRLYGDLMASWSEIVLVNLSAGGMRFRSEDTIPKDTIIEMKLHLPHAHAPLVLHGSVAWSQLQASGVIESGVQFMDVTIEQQAQIDYLVQFLRKNA